MAIRKTYGIKGLMDYVMQIAAGKGIVTIHFSGGALTAYGTTPARYATNDPFFQNVIEHSAQFKSGRIKLLDTVVVPDDAATIRMKERLARRAAVKAKAVAHVAPEAPAAPAPTPAPAEPTVEAPAPAPEAPAEEPTPEAPAADAAETEAEGEGMPEGSNAEESDEGTEGDGVQNIEVGCKADAVEWLKEHFPTKGYNGNNLRANAAFEAACNEAGVRFIIKNA